MAKVFIGVGHGGSDPGACAYGLKEKNLTQAIANLLNTELQRHGVQTKMSRYKDENDPLTQEIQECNAYNPNLAIDVHINAGGGIGFEVFCSKVGGTSRTMATNINAEVVNAGIKSRGVKTKLNSRGNDYFGFIRQINAPSIIVEAGFIDSSDRYTFNTAEGQKKFAICYAKGILKTLGIAYVPANTSKPVDNDEEDDEMKLTIYKTFDDVPNWEGWRECVKFLMDKDIIKGEGNGILNLEYNMLRGLVINYRAGLYDHLK